MKLNIYDYDSAYRFLSDMYKLSKEKQDTSLRDWSLLMGFRSPQILVEILKQKRPIKLKYADHILKALNLSSEEALYFKTLILVEKEQDAKKSYLKEVSDFLAKNNEAVNKNDGLFSHWLNLIIYTLSQMEDFSLNIESIQRAIKEELPLGFISESLNALVDYGMLERNSEGEFFNINKEFIKTTNDTPFEPVGRYYRQVLRRAEQAIEMDVSEREFQCFSIGMNREDLPRAKELMREAREEIALLENKKADHIYQFNFNGFPVAEIR